MLRRCRSRFVGSRPILIRGDGDGEAGFPICLNRRGTFPSGQSFRLLPILTRRTQGRANRVPMHREKPYDTCCMRHHNRRVFAAAQQS